MLTSSILLLVAISGGTLLTFAYDRQTHLAGRTATGAVTGLALLATCGFLFSWWMGLGIGSILLSSAVLLLPWLLLLGRSHRQEISTAFAIPESFTRSTVVYLLFYAVMAALLAAIFSRVLFTRNGVIYTGVVNDLGDLPFHLQVINSFVQGHNFHAEDPTYAGVRFTYPVMADFLSAMLVRSGASLAASLWLPGMVLALALVGVIHSWTLAVTRNRLAGLLAPLLIVSSGGLGWWMIFQDLRNSDHGLLPLLAHLPHDYTIMGGSILRWGNSFTALLVPQRSLLFGLPLAICIFHQWWLATTQTHSNPERTALAGVLGQGTAAAAPRLAPAPEVAPGSRMQMLAAGLFAGLLPLVHAHTFLVILGTGFCLALLFRTHGKVWVVFLAVMLAVAVPECLWLARSNGIHTTTYIGWQSGWDHGMHNPLWFWMVNTGTFIPLLVAAYWTWSKTAVNRKLLLFSAPFFLCLLVPNFVKVAPWIWDNIKVLFYWYIGMVPVAALFLAGWMQRKSWHRPVAITLLISLTMAGALDILRVITRTTEYAEFDPAGISMAQLVSSIAAPQAVVLHAPTYNSPVFLTGRRSLLGYPGWAWSRGIDYAQREADVHAIYAGNPGSELLLRQYHVSYVLLGPQERGSFACNEAFWGRYPVMAHIGDYWLYRAEQTK